MVVQMETVGRQLLNIIQTEFPMEPERSEEVGRIMAANPAVTHCYERPTFPDWPYTHFSMIHAATKDGCDRIAAQISVDTGITDYKVLYSYREYKKTRVRYFV